MSTVDSKKARRKKKTHTDDDDDDAAHDERANTDPGTLAAMISDPEVGAAADNNTHTTKVMKRVRKRRVSPVKESSSNGSSPNETLNNLFGESRACCVVAFSNAAVRRLWECSGHFEFCRSLCLMCVVCWLESCARADVRFLFHRLCCLRDAVEDMILPVSIFRECAC
jgi:hypothetical protein